MSYETHLWDGLRRSVVAFLIVIIALPLISLWSTYQIRGLSNRMHTMAEMRLRIGRTLRLAVDEESSLRGYLATGEPLFLHAYDVARPGVIDNIRSLTSDFRAAGLNEGIPDLQKFGQLHETWQATVATPLIRNLDAPRALALESTGTKLMNQMRTRVKALQNLSLDAEQNAEQKMYDVMVASTAVSVLWIVIVASFLLVFQRRAIHRESNLVRSLVRQREEVERLSEWRSRLLAMLAHDFKSQLAVLIGAAHLLEDFPQRRGDPELLGSIRSAGYTLAEMADNAILLARAQERKIVLQQTVFDVSEIVNGVVQRYGIEREFIVHHGAPTAMVQGDRSYVTRVLDNIIGNAVKYSEQPVDVHLDNEAEFIRVTVQDRGVGIPEAELPHIFEEYWRSDRTSWKQKGSGVGLFIVKTIMEAHGGSINVQSSFGHGTTVTMRFPRALTAFSQIPVTA
jgi:signal transduction histidine kinase